MASATVTVPFQRLDAPLLSVTVNVTEVWPRGYGPGGDWLIVIGSPSGSDEPSSTEAFAAQLDPADAVTFRPLASGAWFCCTTMHWENSEVSRFGPIAVAVMNWPCGTAVEKVTAKLAPPLSSVVTVVEPSGVWPSPKPEGSQAVLEKNSSSNCVLGVLSSVPWMVVPLSELVAELGTGKFCKSFGPESASPGSFGVTPSGPRSIPRPPLEKMEFDLI